MQTLLTNKNRKNKREHRAHCQITKLIKMKKKIISFVGLALFIGAVAFNVQMVNSNDQVNDVVLENIEALADGSVSAGCLCMTQPDSPECYPDECPECGDGIIVCE